MLNRATRLLSEFQPSMKMFLRRLDQHVSCSSIQLLVGWGSWQRLCTLCTLVTTTPAQGHFKSTRCRWSPHPTFCASKECSIKAHLLECKSTTFSAWITYISSSFKELSPFIGSNSQWRDHPTSIPFCLWSNVTAVHWRITCRDTSLTFLTICLRICDGEHLESRLRTVIVFAWPL